MKIMKPQGGGRIINIGSISAQMPRENAAPYAASKHGLVGLTKAVALEGRAYGIVVSCLNPGNINLLCWPSCATPKGRPAAHDGKKASAGCTCPRPFA